MNSKKFLLPTIAVILSFIGGFFIANALNRSEMEMLRNENERLAKAAAEGQQKSSEFTLDSEEIRAKIAEADANPDNVRFNRELGIGLYRYGAIKQDVELLTEAARLLERVNSADPKDYDALVALGNAQFDIANFGKQNERFLTAREIYQKAVAARPNDSNVRTDIALTYFLHEPPQLDLAVNEFNKAISADPKNERALQFLIQALWQKGDLEPAMITLEKLKEVNRANSAIPELTTLLTRTPPAQ